MVRLSTCRVWRLDIYWRHLRLNGVETRDGKHVGQVVQKHRYGNNWGKNYVSMRRVVSLMYIEGDFDILSHRPRGWRTSERAFDASGCV